MSERSRCVLLVLALIGVTSTVTPGSCSAAAPGPPVPKSQPPPASRVVDVKSADGTILKTTYFAAPAPGPGVLLFHQSNRTRHDWAEVARRLAAAGINVLTVDNRGHGESGGGFDNWMDRDKARASRNWPADLDCVFSYLVSQPGVQRDVIGVGGAGVLGVSNSVETARRHTAAVKSLVLLSGETMQVGLQFLQQAAKLPALFVMADDDEYPPTVEAMELAYVSSANPGKRLVHYSAGKEAPWLWYEPVDVGKVPATGSHGTDLFKGHPELPGMIVDWFVTTLIETPGHATADTVASAAIINQLRQGDGIAQVTRQLLETRRQDPQAQLFPEIAVSIIGADHMRVGELKEALEVMELVLLAYPQSADAHENLAEAYLRNGQREHAREHAEKALALLDSHTTPASSWSDTEPFRGETRHGAEDVIKKAGATN